MNLFMIAKSNMKKNKSMMITLIALIMFATLLLYIGTSVLLDMSSFLDKKNESMNGSEFTAATPVKHEETIQGVIKEMGEYTQLETVPVIRYASTFQNLTNGEESQSIGSIMFNADNSEEISRMDIIDQGHTKLPNSIILPYYLKVAKGYQSGDEITITVGSVVNTYIVYGFAEDIMFATPSNIPYYKCYVFEEEFQRLYHADENTQYSLIKTRLKQGTDTNLYSENFIKKSSNILQSSMSDIMSMDYNTMKVGVSIFLIIIMSVLITFSFIIILIALTMMRFAIVTHIEGNIKNIGSMEALGYTGKELILSTILQFVVITLFSIGLGFVIATAGMGLMTNLLSSSIGLAWNAVINVKAMLINLVIIMTLVMLITYLAAAKLKKVTPIIAMRSGIDTHNFKKNYIALDRSPYPVNVALGIKSLLLNMKQNVIIVIIVTLMSFVSVFAFTTNYNFNVDNTALLRLIGIEKSQLQVIYKGEDAVKIFDEIGELEQVDKIIRLTSMEMGISLEDKEMTPSFYISNDFNLLEIQTIVEGEYPVHNNEIAVTGLVLERLGAELGDAVTVKGNETKQDFILVGVTQQISNLGRGACITEEGMARIDPNYVPSELFVYMEEHKIPSVTKTLEERYGDSHMNITNIEETFDTILVSFNGAVIALCIVCIVITLSIISLVLYLLIKIKLLKERLRIGVSKALGYTTKQLVLQITMSFCPVCILGAFLGTVLATFLINPAFSAMLSVSGIRNSHLTINPAVTLTTFLAISLFSFVITALVSRSIKKITPCELFI